MRSPNPQPSAIAPSVFVTASYTAPRTPLPPAITDLECLACLARTFSGGLPLLLSPDRDLIVRVQGVVAKSLGQPAFDRSARSHIHQQHPEFLLDPSPLIRESLPDPCSGLPSFAPPLPCTHFFSARLCFSIASSPSTWIRSTGRA